MSLVNSVASRRSANGVALSLVLCLGVSQLLNSASGIAFQESEQPAQGPIRLGDLDKLLVGYAAGNFEIVRQTFRTPEDFRGLRTNDPHAFDPLVDAWHTQWQVARPMFLLELAHAAYQVRVRPKPVQVPVSLARTAYYDVDLLPMMLRAGRALVFARPARLGADPTMDAFEMRWHRTALGLMQGEGLYDDEDEYVEAVIKRVRNGPSGLTDPRIALARGVARAQADRRRLFQEVEAQERSASIDESLKRFKDAAKLPEVRGEALTRGAFLLMEAGRSAEGLNWLQQVEDDHSDPLLMYWASVCRARALEALNRPEDAELAYRAALGAWPDAQVAEIGLAAVLMKRGRYSEALGMAAAARTALVKTAEPLAAFEAADARFVAGWLRQLRQSLQ